MTNPSDDSSRMLTRALLLNFSIHAVAMVSMLLLLLPGLPGGRLNDIVERATYITNHPWLWRLGWFPWQMTAVADLWLGFALLKTPWISRWPALFTVFLTLAAIIPDQWGQFQLITRGVEFAREAVYTGKAANYQEFELSVYRLVAAWGCLGYIASALGWTWCFSSAGSWSQLLTWWSALTFTCFGLSTVVLALPADHRPSPLMVAGGNAVGFMLLQVWFLLIIAKLRRHELPT